MLRSKVVWLIVLLATPLLAAAQNEMTVTCPPETGGMFSSINQALGALDPFNHNIIYVSGTCQERVQIGDGITGMQNVSITAAPEKTAIIEPPPAGQGRGFVVLVCGSRDIDLSNLVIRNGGIGLQVCDETELDTGNLTIENNTSVGADVYGNSMVFFSDHTVIQNNGQAGVNVRGGSRVFFLHFNAEVDGALVQGHSQWGVIASGGSALEFRGGHQVTGNGAANTESGGIAGIGTTSLRLFSNPAGSPLISGNAGAGVLAKTGSSVTLLGTTVSDNGGAGVLLRLLSVAELTAPNTLAGNAAAISCDQSSWVGGDLTGAAPVDCQKAKK